MRLPRNLSGDEIGGNVMTTDVLISTMVDRIVGGFQPSRVVLFGSHARGTATDPGGRLDCSRRD